MKEQYKNVSITQKGILQHKKTHFHSKIEDTMIKVKNISD